MMFFVSLIKGLAQGYFFRYLSRFLNPELLVGIVFIINLIVYLLFPNKISITTGDSLMLEFVILHANFISIVAAISSPNQEVYKNRQTVVNLFYLVFIVLIAIGLNAWFFMLNYFWLLYHRFTISFNESLKKELIHVGIFTLIRIFLFLITGALAGIINQILSGDDPFTLLLWGTFFYSTLFLSTPYFKKLISEKVIVKVHVIVKLITTTYENTLKR
ncbi:MAG: hypothetical protein LW821_11955 [Flammeovirgaceae bacterium]|nr:hypothetical protein [Flammeovirgaceae bacterium]